ncbi:TetR/AcrR family transcriptional regulator [Ferrimonas sediminicola]|uniref:TetR/AcrR family transcriptional regulator n=1 Tax=Ferrimonas sediminicola TaxID=2569538 RepID=A0A4U1BCG7_9GAMM|nr:TetR/AcrR family transcriptional regulator [Ferrimonas sediminicola]TKB48666.1 TetR/AcrR family transcriptional regulator [Ferrimonas sediminicola]
MSASKRQQILDTALVLFVQQGLEGAATAKIAREAGVATGTLFHHFSNKQALIAALYLEIKQELADRLPALRADQPTREMACRMWQAAMAWALDHPDKIRFLLAYYQSPVLTPATRRTAKFDTLGFVLELIKMGQARGELAPYPHELMMEACHSLFMASAGYFIDHPEQAADPRQQEGAMAIFWNALAAPGHRLP